MKIFQFSVQIVYQYILVFENNQNFDNSDWQYQPLFTSLLSMFDTKSQPNFPEEGHMTSQMDFDLHVIKVINMLVQN